MENHSNSHKFTKISPKFPKFLPQIIENHTLWKNVSPNFPRETVILPKWILMQISPGWRLCPVIHIVLVYNVSPEHIWIFRISTWSPLILDQAASITIHWDFQTILTIFPNCLFDQKFYASIYVFKYIFGSSSSSLFILYRSLWP